MRQIHVWDLFMQIMLVKCWSQIFIAPYIFYVTVDKVLERMNKI